MGGSGFVNGKSGKAFGESMKQRAKEVKTQTQLVARLGLRSIESEFQKRDLAVKKINKQDSPTGREFRKFSRRNATGRLKASGAAIVIQLQVLAFYTGARSKAIKGILTYLGLIPMLFRTSLLVRDRLKKGTQGPVRVRRISFKQNPQLAGWAARADKGSQYLRHVISAKGPILNSLVMQPSLKPVIPVILEDWEKATLTTLRGSR